MKKKSTMLTVILFLVLLFTLFSACGNSGEMKKSSSIWYFGDTDSKDPLRICMDIQEATYLDRASNYATAKRTMEELLVDMKAKLGIQDIVIEFIPRGPGEDGGTVSRATAVKRLRLEILSGGGPDVFVMRYMPVAEADGFSIDSGDTLIKSPQSVMESGLFLPVDDYIENNTGLTEWNKFPKSIMDAGCNSEGQQIIPITYTFPVIIYPREVFNYVPDRLLSWNDLLTDPELSPYASDLLNCRYMEFFWPCLEFTFGQLVDYEEEELLFTEDELLSRVNEIISIDPNDTHGCIAEDFIGASIRSFVEPVTVLPWYCDDGGITARIDAYAAINRNTDRPEDSFAVLDFLLSTEAQQNYEIYSEYFYREGLGGLLMNEEFVNIETGEPLYQNEENYLSICELQKQITCANFDSNIGTLVSNLFSECALFPEYTDTYVHETYEDMQRRVRE